MKMSKWNINNTTHLFLTGEIMEIIRELHFPLPEGVSFKNEASFTTWFGGQIKERGGFFYKISDESRGLKPFDAIASFNGIQYALELKYTKHGSTHPYSLLRGSSAQNPGSQVPSLAKWERNGGNSIVIVYSAKKHTYVAVRFMGLSLASQITFDEN